MEHHQDPGWKPRPQGAAALKNDKQDAVTLVLIESLHTFSGFAISHLLRILLFLILSTFFVPLSAQSYTPCARFAKEWGIRLAIVLSAPWLRQGVLRCTLSGSPEYLMSY